MSTLRVNQVIFNDGNNAYYTQANTNNVSLYVNGTQMVSYLTNNTISIPNGVTLYVKGVDVGAKANAALANTDATFSGNLTFTAPYTIFIGNSTVNTAITAGSITANGQAVGAFASGTVMLFSQNSAPTGWTKKTCYNDVGIRIVSGNITTVTNQSAFTTIFGTCKSTGATTLSTTQIPSHSHSFTYSRSDYCSMNYIGSGGPNNPTGTNTNSAGGGGSHTHTMALNLNYVDMILASKN